MVAGLCCAALSCAAILVVVATPLPVHAQSFEVPSNRSASQILPSNLIASPYHRVRETVVSYGYMHHFTVDSQFGVFEATGDGALRKLVNEMNAIASLKEFKNSDAFDLKGHSDSKGGNGEVIGGSGRWAGATGVVRMKRESQTEDSGSFTFELEITTP